MSLSGISYQRNSIEAESKAMVLRSWTEGRMGSDCLMDTAVSSGVLKFSGTNNSNNHITL
jgi:hypothetical protein